MKNDKIYVCKVYKKGYLSNITPPEYNTDLYKALHYDSLYDLRTQVPLDRYENVLIIDKVTGEILDVL